MISSSARVDSFREKYESYREETPSTLTEVPRGDYASSCGSDLA